MSKQIALLLGLGVFLMAATAAHAVVPANLICKDKKLKETGKKSLKLLKAFGKNIKRSDEAKLGFDVSKADSKFSKGFSKAETKGDGTTLRGCDTVGDAGAIELKVDAFVLQIIEQLSPSGAFLDGTESAF